VARRNFGAAGAPIFDDHARDIGPGTNVDAARRALLRHRLRDRAHAAQRVAPLSALPVHFPEDVMEQYVRRSRLVGARKIADDRVEAECRFERIGFEPAVEEIAGTFGEEIEEIATSAEVEAVKASAEFPRLDEGTEIAPRPGADVGRRPPQ